MKKIILLFAILLFAGCEKEKNEFPIIGEWIGENWHCINDENCSIKYVDKDAALTFDILSIDSDGSLTLSDGKYYKPSCSISGCITRDWVCDSAIFINNQLFILWESGYSFSGNLQDDSFSGFIRYTFGENDEYTYIWNDEIIIRKND